jgi:hypothetical protein
MMSGEVQELLAIAVVATVLGIALWRRWRKRKAKGPACGSQCGKSETPPREVPLRFHRRKR